MKKREEHRPGDKDFPGNILRQLYQYSRDIRKDIKPWGTALDELRPILWPAAVLQSIGPSSQLEKQFTTVREVWKIARETPDLPSRDRDQIEVSLQKLGTWLADLCEDAQKAESELREQGYQFDERTSRVKTIADPQAPCRPTELLNRAIQLAYDEVCEREGVNGNTQKIREQVRDRLGLYFALELLEAGSRRQIWQVIDHWIR